jgi:ribonuclease HIII
LKASAVNIADKIKSIKQFSFENCFMVISEKPINYGVQLKIADNNSQVSVNVYQGKRGVSVVVGGADSELKRHLLIFDSTRTVIRETGKFEIAPAAVWGGSDEAGKGDYFGPLAVAAVSVDKTSAQRLKEIGVRDCKKLGDEKVVQLAEKIKWLDNVFYSEAVLFPKDYNIKYSEFSRIGHNLNDILAQLHAQAARELFQQNPDIEQYIVDKFTADATLAKWFELPKSVKLINVPKAESDIAVAAASVLARALFLQGLEKLDDEFAVQLPKGAAGHVTHYAAKIVRTHGVDILNYCAKKHFKNSLDIAGIVG